WNAWTSHNFESSGRREKSARDRRCATHRLGELHEARTVRGKGRVVIRILSACPAVLLCSAGADDAAPTTFEPFPALQGGRITPKRSAPPANRSCGLHAAHDGLPACRAVRSLVSLLSSPNCQPRPHQTGDH